MEGSVSMNKTYSYKKQVVIRRPWWGNILYILACLAFMALGLDSGNGAVILICLLLFGGCALFRILFGWRPLVIISKEGITIPYGLWGKSFIKWSNVKEIEIVFQKVDHRHGSAKHKCIGVFTFSNDGIAGTEATKVTGTVCVTGIATDWRDAPVVLINTSFSFVDREKIKRVLRQFHEEYKQGRRDAVGEKL